MIRNCHRGTPTGKSDTSITVENVREFMPRTLNALERKNRRYATYRRTMLQGQRGLSLDKMERLGFVVVRRPFMVAEPHHNCMVEIRGKMLDELWKAHIVAKSTFAEKYLTPSDETPMLRLFRLHWQEMRVREDWTAERVRRLCKLWGLTPHELAELIQWSPGGMNSFLGNSKAVGAKILPGPVALWFYFLENTKMGVSVFPSLPETEAQIDL